MDSQDYLEIRVNVPSEDLGDFVVAELSAIGFDAFLYEDGVQKCYIQREEYSPGATASVLDGAAQMLGCTLEWSAQQMPQTNWNQQWEQDGFTALDCGRFLLAPLGTQLPDIGLEPIFLQAQMAFGTGHHHTTFMMLETLQDLEDELHGSSVMDLGCGTAVLAIAAAKLGAAQVAGIDIDAVAVRSAQENLRLNSLDFPIICSDASALQQDAYHFLLANIHRNIIIQDLPLYAKAIKNGGKLLVSGFLQADVEDIRSAAQACGFEFLSGKQREGWQCLVFCKKHQ